MAGPAARLPTRTWELTNSTELKTALLTLSIKKDRSNNDARKALAALPGALPEAAATTLQPQFNALTKID